MAANVHYTGTHLDAARQRRRHYTSAYVARSFASGHIAYHRSLPILPHAQAISVVRGGGRWRDVVPQRISFSIWRRRYIGGVAVSCTGCNNGSVPPHTHNSTGRRATSCRPLRTVHYGSCWRLSFVVLRGNLSALATSGAHPAGGHHSGGRRPLAAASLLPYILWLHLAPRGVGGGWRRFMHYRALMDSYLMAPRLRCLRDR